VLVLVDDAAESVVPVDVEVGDLLRVGDRGGYCTQWRGLFDRLVSAEPVVVRLILVQGVQQVGLVPDQSAVQQLATAGLYLPLHNRVHPRHADPAEHDLDPGLCQDFVEQRRELRVSVPDQVLDFGSGVFEVYDQVARRLGDPGSGGMGRGAQHAHPSGGMLDNSQDALALPGQRDGLDEIARRQRVGLAAQERGPGGGGALRCWVDALVLEDLPNGRGSDLEPKVASSPCTRR